MPLSKKFTVRVSLTIDEMVALSRSLPREHMILSDPRGIYKRARTRALKKLIEAVKEILGEPVPVEYHKGYSKRID